MQNDCMKSLVPITHSLLPLSSNYIIIFYLKCVLRQTDQTTTNNNKSNEMNKRQFTQPQSAAIYIASRTKKCSKKNVYFVHKHQQKKKKSVQGLSDRAVFRDWLTAKASRDMHIVFAYGCCCCSVCVSNA